MITTLGDRRTDVYASTRTIVCLSCIRYFFVSLPLGVGDRQRIVIVTIPGLFIIFIPSTTAAIPLRFGNNTPCKTPRLCQKKDNL